MPFGDRRVRFERDQDDEAIEHDLRAAIDPVVDDAEALHHVHRRTRGPGHVGGASGRRHQPAQRNPRRVAIAPVHRHRHRERSGDVLQRDGSRRGATRIRGAEIEAIQIPARPELPRFGRTHVARPGVGGHLQLGVVQEIEPHARHAVDACLDEHARHEGGDIAGRDRVGRWQPDVQRHDAGFDAEADEEKQERDVARPKRHVLTQRIKAREGVSVRTVITRRLAETRRDLSDRR